MTSNPEVPMHPGLQGLPRNLLNALGLVQSQDALTQTLRFFAYAPALQPRAGAAHVVTVDQGLDLMLQCTNPAAPAAQRQWGLHSFTLRASAWSGAWPEGLNPHTATVQDVATMFTVDPGTVMVSPAVACCVVPGLAQGQQWCVLCTFDFGSGKLQSFSMVRVGEWITGADAPPMALATST